MGLSDIVEFAGNVDDIGAYYRHRIDALLVPSRFEGQSRVVAEAQLFGLPTIISGCVPDCALLDDRYCTRVKSFEIEHWAQALLAVAHNQFQLSEMKFEGANDHEYLSLKHGVNALIETINAA